MSLKAQRQRSRTHRPVIPRGGRRTRTANPAHEPQAQAHDGHREHPRGVDYDPEEELVGGHTVERGPRLVRKKAGDPEGDPERDVAHQSEGHDGDARQVEAASRPANAGGETDVGVQVARSKAEEGQATIVPGQIPQQSLPAFVGAVPNSCKDSGGDLVAVHLVSRALGLLHLKAPDGLGRLNQGPILPPLQVQGDSPESLVDPRRELAHRLPVLPAPVGQVVPRDGLTQHHPHL